MGTFYTNTGHRGPPGFRGEDDDGDDYENMATPYKDLPPKPNSMAPPRPPRAGKKANNPPRPHKSPKITGLDVPSVTGALSQLGVQLEPPPVQLSLPTTPVSWPGWKPRGSWCHQEERLLVSLCLLVVVALFLGITSLVVTLVKYQEVVEELRTLTFQQTVWRANVTGLQGLAGLQKDLDHVRADTNHSLTELRGLLDCPRITCPKGWLPFRDRCYYFSPTTKSWEGARVFCQENYSHLVIISDAEEQKFVAQAHQSPRVYWLGLTDRLRENDWRWLDNSPVTLSFWGPHEPNNLNNKEHCGSMSQVGSWNDLSCDTTTYWVCERKCSC